MEFFGRACVDRERVDVGLHQFAERGVHSAMTCQRQLALERHADDVHAEVAAAIARTGMANVTMALVLDCKLARRERCDQALANLLDPGVQGATRRNGRTLTSAYTPAPM